MEREREREKNIISICSYAASLVGPPSRSRTRRLGHPQYVASSLVRTRTQQSNYEK